MPTFTDLLKFRLILNVKDYASPIQEDKRGIIPATLEDFCEKFTQVTPYGTAMKFHCADDAVICGRHLSAQVTSITMWQITCSIWKRGCKVHCCSNRKTVRTDHKAMLLTDT